MGPSLPFASLGRKRHPSKTTHTLLFYQMIIIRVFSTYLSFRCSATCWISRLPIGPHSHPEYYWSMFVVSIGAESHILYAAAA